jgi:hypothetical protein
LLGLGILTYFAGDLRGADAWAFPPMMCGLEILLIVAPSMLIYRRLAKRSTRLRQEAELRKEPDRPLAAPGFGPKFVVLAVSSFFGWLLVAVGSQVLSEKMSKSPDALAAFWAGLSAALGALLGLVTGRVFSPRPRWKCWATVMEDLQWNRFDYLTVAWIVFGVLGLSVVDYSKAGLPWLAHVLLRNLATIFILQGLMFMIARLILRQEGKVAKGRLRFNARRRS